MKNYDYSKLKALREEQNLTQDQIAALLNISQGAYNKIERGNRKRKSDSIQDIEKLAEAFKLTPARLISILTNQDDIRASGIKESDLWQIHKMLVKEPLREDEFVFFSTDLLDIDKYEFKKDYLRIDDSNMDELYPSFMENYPPPIKIIVADIVEIGFDFTKKNLTGISIWIANKKLGIVNPDQVVLINELIANLMISRVLLIENEDCVPGFVDMYMKVVFIGTNAVCKSAEFKKGRFTKVKLMTEEEVKKNEEIETN